MSRAPLSIRTLSRSVGALVFMVAAFGLCWFVWRGWLVESGVMDSEQRRTSSQPIDEAGVTASNGVTVRRDQIARGGEIYLLQCKRCHDSNETSGLNVIAPVLDARALAWHGSGDQLSRYVSLYMPFDRPGTLTDDQYFDVLAFVLDINALLPPEVVLGPSTIGRLRFDPFHPSVSFGSIEGDELFREGPDS